MANTSKIININAQLKNKWENLESQEKLSVGLLASWLPSWPCWLLLWLSYSNGGRRPWVNRTGAGKKHLVVFFRTSERMG